ncbi:MAG: DUF2490 domain-containing protein [Pirellulales bacterium]|nr:DUF2490 domain-containing protein [Pirellulales bacterium]
MGRIPALFWLLISFILMPWADRACAQAVDDAGLWNAMLTQGNFEAFGLEDTKLKWWFDGHLRYLDDAGGFNQSIVRPGIGWTLNERSTVWAGYGWIRTSALSGLEFDEHRIWQQWTWSKNLEDWKLGLRSRFEQRFVETGDDLGLRFRQFFRATHKLPSVPKMTLGGWIEIFYNLNHTDWGAQGGINQNRVFAGLGYKPSPECHWRVEIGYLNQVIEIPSGRDRSHHILSLNFFRSP